MAHDVHNREKFDARFLEVIRALVYIFTVHWRYFFPVDNTGGMSNLKVNSTPHAREAVCDAHELGAPIKKEKYVGLTLHAL